MGLPDGYYSTAIGPQSYPQRFRKSFAHPSMGRTRSRPGTLFQRGCSQPWGTGLGIRHRACQSWPQRSCASGSSLQRADRWSKGRDRVAPCRRWVAPTAGGELEIDRARLPPAQRSRSTRWVAPLPGAGVDEGRKRASPDGNAAETESETPSGTSKRAAIP